MPTVKAIFVGDEPNKNAVNRTPFVHAKCASRLQEWIDYLIGDEDYVIVNQCDVSSHDILCMSTAYDCMVIALGNKASKHLSAIATIKVTHFKLPHPSGLNRQLNDKAKLFLKLRECKRYLG